MYPLFKKKIRSVLVIKKKKKILVCKKKKKPKFVFEN